MSPPSGDEATTVVQTRFDPSPPPTSSYDVCVVEGPQAGRRVTVDDTSPGRVLVGSSALCELHVADREASRRHLALELGASWLRVEDLGSTNGTFVNGVRVREAFLTGGERVRVGSTVLSVEARAAQAASVSHAEAFGSVKGASREMQRLYPLCERIAKSTVPVVIEGETGTGKEVLAESLHDLGPRAGRPFVVFDCTTTAGSLLESDLFGHEKGAFTGAIAQRKGVFEEADGGTLFIDEIGDLDLEMQPKLLRALERSQIRRVGGSRWIEVDVRIITATRRNLDAEVEAGRFRDDLFHRLAVARIELPPLASRKGDVPILARAFAARMGAAPDAIAPDILSRWERLPWKGNVRELRNAVTKYLALGEAPPIEADGASTTIDEVIAAKLPFAVARQRVLELFERRYLEHVLAEHGGNVSHAAAASGIGRRYFQMLRAKQR